MINDKARMHEVVSYSLYRDMNVPASRATYANLTINDIDFGVFALVEQVDSEFIRARFSDHDGLLFKEIWPSNLNLDDADWPLSNSLKTHKKEFHEFLKIKEFAADSQSIGENEYSFTMSRWLDMEAFKRYMIVDRLIENFDGIVAFYCFEGFGCVNHNFYLYEQAEGNGHWLIPWDLDLTFPVKPEPHADDYGVATFTGSRSCDWIATAHEASLRAPGCDGIIGGFVENKWADYTASAQEALAGELSLTAINTRIDEFAALLEQAITNDPTTHLTPEDWEYRVGLLRDNADVLRSYFDDMTENATP